MSYAKFLNFGMNTNNNINNPADVSNPLTYCLVDSRSVQFLHGSTASTYSPQCKECQHWMANRCAGEYSENETWDKYCKFYYNNNNDTNWPNNASINKVTSSITQSIFKLTQGQMLLRNSAERKYLQFPYVPNKYQQFDPNVANSPMIRIPLDYDGYTSVNVIVDPSKIDNDPLMDACIEDYKAVSDVFVYIYQVYKNKTLNLEGTKLGKHFQENSSFYENITNVLVRGNPNVTKGGLTYSNMKASAYYGSPVNTCL